MYTNRIEAGRALAPALLKYKNEDGIVLAVPKGGIPLGYEIAHALQWPLEPVWTKKIGHPQRREYAIGAMSTSGSVITPHRDVPDEYIRAERARIGEYLAQMQKKFMGDRPPASLENKIVVVVDDGIATGHTLLTTIELIRSDHPKRVIVTAPVSAGTGYEILLKRCDELIVPVVEHGFFDGVGAHYEDFDDVSEDEALYYLEKNRRELRQLSQNASKAS